MASKKSVSSDFIVRFEGVDLPKETRERIAEAIQAAAFAEFAKLDLAHDYVTQIPPSPGWNGIELRPKKVALQDGLAVPKLRVVEE
jgi:hypothetical protein